MKLLNLAADQVAVGSDGLMHLKDGVTADADPVVTLKSGVREVWVRRQDAR
jgi:flagellar basal-body rod protein FlgF